MEERIPHKSAVLLGETSSAEFDGIAEESGAGMEPDGMDGPEVPGTVCVSTGEWADTCRFPGAQPERPNACDRAGALYRRVVSGPTDSLVVQFFRYTIVGGIAFLADFGVLVLLTSGAGLHYLLSAALAFLAGSATNYVLSTAWVFHKRTFSDRRLEVFLFCGIGLIGLGLNEALMWLLTDGAGLHYTLSKLGATLLVYSWNFLARRFCLFR